MIKLKKKELGKPAQTKEEGGQRACKMKQQCNSSGSKSRHEKTKQKLGRGEMEKTK